MPKDTRRYFGKTNIPVPTLNLTQIQRDSYAWFIQEGIPQILTEISPIEDFTGKNWRLHFGQHTFDTSKYTPSEALARGVTYDAPLRVDARLENLRTGQVSQQEIFLGDFPMMTERGTFVINGIERAVVNQLVRSPGVYFLGEVDPATGLMLYYAELRPQRGSWLEFHVTRSGVITVRIDRRRKFPATTLLRAIGMTEEEMQETFAKVDTNPDRTYIANTVAKDPTRTEEEALLEIYRKMRPGDPVVLDNAKALLTTMFFDPRRYSLSAVGRYKINKRLGLGVPSEPEGWVLTKEDFIGTTAYLIQLQNGEGKVDDIDHLGNRRVRRVGELVQQNAFRVGMLRLERAIRERMSLLATEDAVTPTQLINARPIIACLNEFFRQSQLSAILDQTNPLSEVDNLRRLSVMGAGGITRERASFSIRDINHSQYGRICPIRSPEGPNIGLVTYMALFARVNEYGFLETPYRRVVKDEKTRKMRVTDEIVYLAADDEEHYYITHAEVPVNAKGYITATSVPVRFSGEFQTADTSLVSFIDLIPKQIVGTSASLIPFLAHDEANRALMGTHMQCQAVPLLKPSAPRVGTGMERIVAQSMGRVVYSTADGEVVLVDGSRIVVQEDGQRHEYPVAKFVRSPQSTCYSQRPVVRRGAKVKKGDLLIDGPACEEGELALGQNLLIAYMSFDGLGYEDAIVISDRLVHQDSLSSIHIEEYEAAVVDTKLGPEETTRDIPNVGEEDLVNLDKDGIVVLGAHVGPNDVLVGKIAPKGETELTAEERLLRAIFGEKAREVRDTSLRMPHGERGTVVDVQILSRERGDELEPGTNRLTKVKVAQMRKVTVGDKLAGRHGNKGIISKIVPQADMPYLADGTPVDIIISPLSVLARMNLGQLLETHLGWAIERKNEKVALPVFEKVDEATVEQELMKAGLPTTGKVKLYDGRTGKPFDQDVVVGVSYIMKLVHMVEDKTHARSTGPYSLVTQQPLGGKAQMGGQRLGEMEVWALESHRAAFTLQEMLTIKSDDVVGRAKAFEAIVKGVDIPQALVPESFKVLVKELNSLAIKVAMEGAVVVKEEAAQTQEGENAEGLGRELAEAAGAKVVAEEKR